MFNPLVARAVTALLLAVAGVVALGCESSPLPSPTSSSAPIVSSVSPNMGSTDGAAMIRVAGTGFLSGATVTLDGLAAQVTSVSSAAIVARTPAHALGKVDVVVTNPDGTSGRLQGGYTFEVFAVAASASAVTTAGQLTVSFVAPSGQGCRGGGDWIAIYRVGDPDVTGAVNGHSDLWYEHVCGATSGAFTLTAPTRPGEYEFRFLIGDAAVARSGPVTVTASS